MHLRNVLTAPPLDLVSLVLTRSMCKLACKYKSQIPWTAAVEAFYGQQRTVWSTCIFIAKSDHINIKNCGLQGLWIFLRLSQDKLYMSREKMNVAIADKNLLFGCNVARGDQHYQFIFFSGDVPDQARFFNKKCYLV